MPPFEQTQLQREQALKDAGVTLPTTSVTTPITSTSLTPVTSPRVATTPEAPVPPISTLPKVDVPQVGNAIVGLEDIERQISGFDTERAVSLKTADEQRALNEINKRILLLQAREEEAAGRAREQGDTLGFARGEEAAVRREAAVEAMKLNAVAQATLGNLTLARDTAREAVKTEFAQLEREAQTARQNIIDNWDIFDEGQRRRAESTLLKLNEKDTFIAERKAEKEAINTLMFKVAQFGASSDVVQSIGESRSYDDALVEATPYLQDPRAKLELQKLQYDIERSRLEIAAFGKTGSGGDTSIQGTPLVTTGNTIKDIAGVIASNKVGATTKTQLGTIVGVLGAVEKFASDNPEGKFKGLSPLNRILDVEIPFTDTKLFNIPFGARDAVISEEGIASRTYINGINLKIQQWASGAALTEQQTKQVEQMTPKVGDTDRVIRNKTNELYKFMTEQIRGQLISEGIDFDIATDVDLWKKKNTLADIFGAGEALTVTGTN